MTSATKKKRTWTGYACPVCRFVFRVPKGHQGVGVICPACYHLLKLSQHVEGSQITSRDLDGPKPIATKPHDKKESKPILARPLTATDTVPPSDQEPSSTGSALQSQNRQRVTRKKSPLEPAPSWESQASSSTSADGNPLTWIVGGALISLTVVGIGAWLAMDNFNSKEKTKSTNYGNPLADGGMGDAVELTEDDLINQEEIKASVNTRMDVMVGAEKVVRGFLTAETSAELESLVRTPEVTVPRMRAWYTKHPWSPPGAKQIDYLGGASTKGVMHLMSARLNDFSVKHVAVERTAKGYLVDWESWVAWPEMEWDELFEKRPTESVQVRVTCTMDDYYNRLFRDDTKWQAVKIEYPDADRAVYGYVDHQTSTLKSFLRDLKGRNSLQATIKIRFPEGSVANNQVIIEEYVQNGWVRPPADKVEKPPVSSGATTPTLNE